MIGIDISKCTGNPETCLTVQDVFEADSFYETIQELDPQAPEMRQILGDFVTACAKRTCMGCNPDLAEQLLRHNIQKGKPSGDR